MTRDEWHRERMEQERLEDAQVEAREEAEFFQAMDALMMKALAMLVEEALAPADDPIGEVPYPKGSDGAW